MAEAPARQQTVPFRTSFWQLVGLTAFAVAQPFFDVLGQHGEFLVAHRASPGDIVLLMLCAVMALPVILLVLEALAGLFHRRLRTGLGLVFRWILLAMILSPPIQSTGLLQGYGILAAAGLLGAVGIGLAFRIAVVRNHLAILALAAPLFCLHFFLQPGIRQQVFTRQHQLLTSGQDNTLTPVVFVIFDELPVTSLLDQQRRIDPVLYPNFAALANQSTWYPNATTVSGATLRSIPASLTGSHPLQKTPPNLTSYPANLFTYLRGTHRFVVEEPQTRLCPDELRLGTPATSTTGTEADSTMNESNAVEPDRIPLLFSDCAVIYLNIILPEDIAAHGTELGNRWTGFVTEDEPSPDSSGKRITRLERYDRFLKAFEPGEQPVIGFIHTILPHNPYHLMPSGTVYNYRPGVPKAAGKHWSTDELVVLHSYRRSLLQLQYVDTLLGQLMNRLKEIGQYDSAMLIITADHGASYRPGDFHRLASQANLADLMSIPLIIKLPGQTDGIVDNRFVQSIDVLPTILEVLEIDPVRPCDGLSLLDDAGFAPRELRFDKFEAPVSREKLAERFEILNWKIAAFGPGGDPDALYRYEAHNELVGKQPEQFVPGRDPDITYRLDNAKRLDSVRRSRRFVPAEITGTLHSDSGFPADVDIAVVINGTIAAVGSTYQAPAGVKELSWCVLARETAIATGRNDVTIYRISVNDGRISLHALAADDNQTGDNP